VTSPADVALWQNYVRLLEQIKKDKRFDSLNHHPPPEAFENGKVIAIVGRQGTHTHKGNHEVNFEYSSFKPMLVKRDVITKIHVLQQLMDIVEVCY
jgi:hypothetical protein